MRRTRVVAVGAILLLSAADLGAQTEAGAGQSQAPPRFLIGYVVNGPSQLIGGGVAWLPSFLNGWGLYADVKTDADPPSEKAGFLDDVTAEEALELGAVAGFIETSYSSVNVALVRAVSPELLVYLGGGVSEETVFAQFFDESETFSNSGQFGAEFADEGGVGPNVMGGLFIRLSPPVIVQFGAEALPAGVTVGVHLGF